tara:strand:- start:1055 stop:1684 length:630 start_codon:yes stop_codon:yes gene_type:complete
MNKSLIIEGVSKSFESNQVFKNLNFNLPIKKIYNLKGTNGSGKTTLFKIISGLILPDKGSVKFINEDLISRNVSSNLVAYINNDDRSFFLRLSVKENLSFFLNLVGKSFKSEQSNLMKLLSILNCSHLIEEKMNSLSRGQMMIINLVRGLAVNPKIILIDEAIDSIDEGKRNTFFVYLKEYLSSNDALCIIVTHNVLLDNKDNSTIFLK